MGRPGRPLFVPANVPYGHRPIHEHQDSRSQVFQPRVGIGWLSGFRQERIALHHASDADEEQDNANKNEPIQVAQRRLSLQVRGREPFIVAAKQGRLSTLGFLALVPHLQFGFAQHVSCILLPI